MSTTKIEVQVFKNSAEFDVVESVTRHTRVNHPVITHTVDIHTMNRPWWKIPADTLDSLFIQTYEITCAQGDERLALDKHSAEIREIHGKDVVLVHLPY